MPRSLQLNPGLPLGEEIRLDSFRMKFSEPDHQVDGGRCGGQAGRDQNPVEKLEDLADPGRGGSEIIVQLFLASDNDDPPRRESKLMCRLEVCFEPLERGPILHVDFDLKCFPVPRGMTKGKGMDLGIRQASGDEWTLALDEMSHFNRPQREVDQHPGEQDSDQSEGEDEQGPE